MKEYAYKSIGGGFKDIDTTRMTVTGVFSKFDVEDADKDVIRFGAFAKSIAERGPSSSRPRIKHFLNHDIYAPLGALQKLEERTSDNDLYYESLLGFHQLGKDFTDMALSGLITEHSIGFKPIAYKDRENGGGWEFTEVKLWEGSSLTAWGANEYTPMIGMKSVSKELFMKRLADRKGKLEDFVRNSKASDEMLELLTIEIKQLNQLVVDILEEKSTPDESSQEEDKEPLVKEYQQQALTLLKLLKYRI
jgi:uncharacterized protein